MMARCFFLSIHTDLSRFDFSGDRIASQPNDLKASNHISPTPFAKQSAMRGFGKENGASGFSPQVHRRPQLPPSASHIYPGQVFYDPILNPLYDPSFARSFPTYVGHQAGCNEESKPPLRFNTSPHGQYKPIHPVPRSAQNGYGEGAGANTNGQGMHYGI